MDQEKQSPSPALVEQYRRQMMELYGKQTPPPQEEENWLDRRFPEPDPERDRLAIPAIAPITEESIPDPEPEPEPEPIPTPTPPESDYIGYLRVFVFTSEEAEPLENARVVVSRQGEVYANLETDRDGYTPVIPLPSVDPALSQRPGNPTPFTTYDIRVEADGFQPARYGNVPVYGNNYVTQPAAMRPVLPGENPEDTRQFSSGGPTNL